MLPIVSAFLARKARDQTPQSAASQAGGNKWNINIPKSDDSTKQSSDFSLRFQKPVFDLGAGRKFHNGATGRSRLPQKTGYYHGRFEQNIPFERTIPATIPRREDPSSRPGRGLRPKPVRATESKQTLPYSTRSAWSGHYPQAVIGAPPYGGGANATTPIPPGQTRPFKIESPNFSPDVGAQYLGGRFQQGSIPPSKSDNSESSTFSIRLG